MLSLRDHLKCGALAILVISGATAAWAEEARTDLFKVVTVKDEIIIGLSADELKALGGPDANAVAHALAQKGDLTVWQYNVHRGANGELQQRRPPNRPARQFIAARRALRHALRDRAASVIALVCVNRHDIFFSHLRKPDAGCPSIAMDTDCGRSDSPDVRGILFNVLRMRSQMQAASHWDRIEGVITVSRVDQPPSHVSDDLNDATPVIRYRYRVGGQDLEGDQVRIGGIALTTRVLAGGLVARYPVGARVDVHIDPNDLKNALLERSSRAISRP